MTQKTQERNETTKFSFKALNTHQLEVKMKRSKYILTIQNLVPAVTLPYSENIQPW